MFSRTATNRTTTARVYSGHALNKKGSYIVEAAITLPLFIIAVVVMSSIILMYNSGLYNKNLTFFFL